MMCPAPRIFEPAVSVLLPLEPETHKRVRVLADNEGKTLTYFLIELIERVAYPVGGIDEREFEEDRLAIRGQRTPGTLPWNRGFSRAYRAK